MSGDTTSKSETDYKPKEVNVEEIDFMININNMIGQFGAIQFLDVLDAVSKAVFILQKDGYSRNIVNITLVANKILQTESKLNRAEAICTLYYLHNNIGNVFMDMNTGHNEMPTWSIKEELFDKLCAYV